MRLEGVTLDATLDRLKIQFKGICDGLHPDLSMLISQGKIVVTGPSACGTITVLPGPQAGEAAVICMGTLYSAPMTIRASPEGKNGAIAYTVTVGLPRGSLVRGKAYIVTVYVRGLPAATARVVAK